MSRRVGSQWTLTRTSPRTRTRRRGRQSSSPDRAVPGIACPDETRGRGVDVRSNGGSSLLYLSGRCLELRAVWAWWGVSHDILIQGLGLGLALALGLGLRRGNGRDRDRLRDRGLVRRCEVAE